MEELINYLSSLGPWGVAAGAVLAAVLYYLRSRRPDLIPPKPDPNAPKPDEERFPILNAILKKLFGVPSVRDVKPEQLEALKLEIDELAADLARDAEAKVEKFGSLVKPADAGTMSLKEIADGSK